MNSITLSSFSNSRNANDKNYVSRIVGRDPKFTFERTFLGKEATIDEAGLYEVCNVLASGMRRDRIEKQQVYRLLANDGGQIIKLAVGGDNADGASGRETAMEIARRLGDGEAFANIIELIKDGGKVLYRVRSK